MKNWQLKTTQINIVSKVLPITIFTLLVFKTIPALAVNLYSQSNSQPCENNNQGNTQNNIDPNRPNNTGESAKSVPEPYSELGIVAFGVLGAGVFFKQRGKFKNNRLRKNTLISPISSTSQKIAFVESSEISVAEGLNQNHHSSYFAFEIIDPQQGITEHIS